MRQRLVMFTLQSAKGSLFGVASKDGVGGFGHTELGVHVALSPSDCGIWRDKRKTKLSLAAVSE